MKLTNEERQLLKNAGSQLEWDKIVDKIVADRNGQYPSDWSDVLFGKVIPRYLLKPLTKGE